MLIWLMESALAAGFLAGIAWAFSKHFPNRPGLLHLAWVVVMIRLVMPPLPINFPISQSLQHLGQQSLRHLNPDHEAAMEESFPSSSQTGEHLATIDKFSTQAASPPHTNQPRGDSRQTWELLDSEVAGQPIAIRYQAPTTYAHLETPVDELTTRPAQTEALITPPPPFELGALATWPWLLMSLIIWITGSLFLAGFNGFKILAMHRKLAQAPFGEIALINQVTNYAEKMGISPPPVVMLDQIATPFVWCLGKPLLVWPSKLMPWGNNTGQTEMLIHELAHIKRRDPWFIWLELTIGIVFWWHPLFWLARSQMRFYAELACDATVIDQRPHLRESYARALVGAMAQLQFSKPQVGALALGPSKKKAFEKRLAAIMNKKTTLKMPLWALLTLSLAGFLVLPALNPRPQPTPLTPATQDVVDALDFLDPASRDKVQARATYRLAKRYTNAQDWDAAETLLKESLQLNPGDSHVWSKYGEVLLESGKYQEAIDVFEKHKKLGRYSQGELRIAQALALDGQLDQAMRKLQDLARKGELHPESLGDTELSSLAEKPGYAELALQSLQYHKQADQARKAMNKKDYRKAADIFQGLTQIAPESCWVWDRLCYVLVPLKEFDIAEQALEKAIELAPETSHLYYNKACIAVLKGNNSRAIPFLNQALDMGFDNIDLMRRDPDLDGLRRNAAFKKLMGTLEAERQIGKQIEDLHDARRNLELLEVLDGAARLKTLDDKDRAYLYRMRGLTNLKLDNYEEAAKAFSQQLSLVKPGKMKNPLYNLACAYNGQGRTQEALASLKASIAVGYKNYHHMEKDKDLETLWDEPAFMEMVQQVGRERLLRRYNQTDWASFNAWLDQQLQENDFTRKELGKLAKNLYKAKAWSQAGRAYSQLSELDSDADIPYNAACSYALAGDKDLAFQWLEKAVSAGFHNWRHMRRDSDLDLLKTDARWQRIRDSL